MSTNRLTVADAPVAPLLPLPTELNLLFVGVEEPSWTLLTLQLDRLGCTRPKFRWCSTLAEAARLLRYEGFDCVIIDDATTTEGGSAAADDLPSLLNAVRAAGCDDPVLLLTDRIDDTFLAEAADCNWELLLTRNGWKSPAVIPWIRRAIERWKIARERDLNRSAERNQTHRQQDESTAVLARRRELAAQLLSRSAGTPPVPAASERLCAAYEDLLRTGIACGSANGSEELERMLHQMQRSGLSPSRALALHLATVEKLLDGLTGSTARHVLERADLLALELLARLGDRHRSQGIPYDAGLDLLHSAEDSPGTSCRLRD